MLPLNSVVVTVFVVKYWVFLPGAGTQVVAIQLLPELATSGAHAVTSVGPDVAGLQVVATQLLPTVAADGVQVATGTSVVSLAPQVVVV